LALPLAWASDHALGEPRNALHPVAWLGRILAPIGAWLVGRSASIAFAGGVLAWLGLAAGIAWIASAWQQTCARLPPGVTVEALRLRDIAVRDPASFRL